MNKKLYRDGPYEDFFSQGVLVGNILTLAGQIGVDEEGNSPEDIKGQMVICYKNICNVLTHFGGTLENVIDETWFVTNVDECMENVTEIFSEREKIYGCKPEVSQTLVGVSALVQPNLKIEIKCIAYID
ncbi:MAG: RidA family protein [Gammaproteobacteria bacterium]|nr:MAG: RidA family protein [Gammaproteobacteria bacterium]